MGSEMCIRDRARAAGAPFARYAAISPSIWWNPAVVAAQPESANLLVAVGAREEMEGLPPAHLARRMVSNARDLEARGASLRVLEDEDHLTVAPVGFTRALEAVLPAR